VGSALDAEAWHRIIEYLGRARPRMHPASGVQAVSRRADGPAGFTGPRTLRRRARFFHAFATRRLAFHGDARRAGSSGLAAGIASSLMRRHDGASTSIVPALVADGLRTDDIVAIECETAEASCTVVEPSWQHRPQRVRGEIQRSIRDRVGMLRGDAGLANMKKSFGIRGCAVLCQRCAM
jgi:hypothetical protein